MLEKLKFWGKEEKEMRYCKNCGQMVEPKKHRYNILTHLDVIFSIASVAVIATIFINIWVGLLVLALTPVLIYVTSKRKQCPICGARNWGKKD